MPTDRELAERLAEAVRHEIAWLDGVDEALALVVANHLRSVLVPFDASRPSPPEAPSAFLLQTDPPPAPEASEGIEDLVDRVVYCQHSNWSDAEFACLRAALREAQARGIEWVIGAIEPVAVSWPISRKEARDQVARLRGGRA